LSDPRRLPCLFAPSWPYTLFIWLSGAVAKAAEAAWTEFGKGVRDCDEPRKPYAGTYQWQAWLIAGSRCLLVLGSNFLVEGHVELARALALSRTGNRIPDGNRIRHFAAELATSISRRHTRERDIAVGNNRGSNIFNLLLAYWGLASLAIATGKIAVFGERDGFDFPVIACCRRGPACDFFAGDYTSSAGKALLFIRLYTSLHARSGDEQHRTTFGEPSATRLLAMPFADAPLP